MPVAVLASALVLSPSAHLVLDPYDHTGHDGHAAEDRGDPGAVLEHIGHVRQCASEPRQFVIPLV